MKTYLCSSAAHSMSVQKRFGDTPVRLVLRLPLAVNQTRPNSHRNHTSEVSTKRGSVYLLMGHK